MQKAIRIGLLVAVVGLFFGIIIFNALNPAPPDMTSWNEKMTIGNAETAKHHFVMYTDIFCPYCDKFSDAVSAHYDSWKKEYIDNHNVLFEIRVTDMNYENGHSDNSRPAGEAAYCAAKQGDFWSYYYALIAKLYVDYHSKGIGVDRYAEKIPNLDNSYFYDIADGLESIDRDKLVSCMENHETAKELDSNTKKAMSKTNGGVPYFVFDKFKTSGFAGNWNTDNDYKEVKRMMDAGLSTK